MSEELNLFNFNPRILTGMSFEGIEYFRLKRDALCDQMKESADELVKKINSSWLFTKRLDSSGDMVLHADIGKGERYLIVLSNDSIAATAYKTRNFDFFLKIVSPLFEKMLSEIQRQTVSFLGMMFEFDLIVDGAIKKGKLIDTWPFSVQVDHLIGCDSKENIEANSVTFSYRSREDLTHYLSGSLRMTGRNRINFKMDTRRETGLSNPSLTEISSFYNSAKEYVNRLINEPLLSIFEKSKPEE